MRPMVCSPEGRGRTERGGPSDGVLGDDESHGWSTWEAGNEKSRTDGAPGGLEVKRVARMKHLGSWK